MVISAECLVTQTNTCLSGDLTICAVAQLIGVRTNLNNTPYAVACTALLPDATCNTGRLVYVTDIQSYRFSDGASWIRNFTGSAPLVNLMSWGRNSYGELGDQTTVNRNSPVTPSGASGYNHTWCTAGLGLNRTGAIKTDGTLWTWGTNLCGGLGDGTTISRSSPGTTAGGGTTWCQASASTRHMAAVKTDGTLWTWGCGGFLGNNSTVDRSSPGTTAGGGTTWCQVSAARYHTVSVKTDGTLWTWGDNNCGQLGNNTTIQQSSPGTTVGGGTTWCQVSTLFGSNSALKTDGTLWTWGNNVYGNLGDGTVICRSSPVTTAGGGTTWCDTRAAASHTNAVKNDGTLWTWGENLYGQLGDGTVISRSSPGTTIGGGTTWKSAAGGVRFTAAVKTDGTMWTWGLNNVGQLGNSSIINRSSPVTVSGTIKAWCQVSAGENHSSGISS